MKKLLLVTLLVSLALPLFSQSMDSPKINSGSPTIKSNTVLQVIDYENQDKGEAFPEWIKAFNRGDTKEIKRVLELEDYYVFFVSGNGKTIEEAKQENLLNLDNVVHRLVREITPIKEGENKEQKLMKAYLNFSSVHLEEYSSWCKVAKVSNDEVIDTYYKVYTLYYFPYVVLNQIRSELSK